MVGDSILNNIEDAFIRIGYKHNLIQKDYKYADLFSSNVPVRTVRRAVFGYEPFDYRSACFGIQIAEPTKPSDTLVHELKALGAPHILIIHNGITERWSITAKEPILHSKYKTSSLPNIIAQNSENWEPDSIIRSKSGFIRPMPQQLDFIDIGLLPALDHEAGKKIDHILQIILNRI